MTPTLEAALLAIRSGCQAEAETTRDALSQLELARFELAVSERRGDGTRALELATLLWHAVEVDATVLAVLVKYEHPALRHQAASLLMRSASDAAYNAAAAWQLLTESPDDLSAWRDVLASLVARGREVTAIDGVARALSERHADFDLWALLITTLLAYRRRTPLLLALELGRWAFSNAPELRATAALIFLGFGDHTRAAVELEAIGARAVAHPLVIAARSALVDAQAQAG